MQYNQPLDQPTNPNAPYFDGNPQAGLQGSIVPASSLEFDQREVVEVITRANVRGYVDFSGTPCAPPGNGDLQQLRKAIEGFITGWSFIIDTTITFHVHGVGADFIDLNAAMFYLRKYYITIRGHVILQCAGSASGTATQYIYTTALIFRHPNLDRVSVYGAKMIAPVPVSYSGYASNGPSAPQRNTDTNTNLAMLRTKFATEFHFTNSSGVWIGPNCPTLMHFDALLLTGDGSTASGINFYNSFGELNNDTYSGIATVNFGAGGIGFELGCSVSIEGPALNETTLCPLIVLGCGNASGGPGVYIGDGSYMTMSGNIIAMGNAAHGFMIHPRGGTQHDGGLHSQSNGQNGMNLYLTSTDYTYGPMSAGTAYTTSTLWKNGQWGLWAADAWSQAYIHCGAGTGNANAAGSVYSAYGANVHPTAGDQAISGACSPPWGVIGNNNAFIG
jgi:hypothetical protein